MMLSLDLIYGFLNGKISLTELEFEAREIGGHTTELTPHGRLRVYSNGVLVLEVGIDKGKPLVYNIWMTAPIKNRSSR